MSVCHIDLNLGYIHWGPSFESKTHETHAGERPGTVV